MINIKAIILPLIISFISLSAFGQTRPEIDLFNQKAEQQSQEGRYNDAIKTAYRAIVSSNDIDYEKGAQEGYQSIAMILSNVGEYEKSIRYIRKAEAYKAYLQNHREVQLELLTLQIFNYNDLGLPSMADSVYNKALSIALKEKNIRKRNRFLLNLYTISHLAYTDEKKTYHNFLEAKSIIDNQESVFDRTEPLENILMTKADVYGKLAAYHLTKKSLDSARYYYDAIKSLTGKMQNKTFVEATLSDGYSHISEAQGYYSDALNELTKAENILKRYKADINFIPIYERKAELYHKLNDNNNEQKYKNLYKQLSEKFGRAASKGRDETVLKILEDNEREMELRDRKRLTVELLAAGFISLITVAGCYFLFKKYLKLKSDVLLESEQRIVTQQQELNKKNIENQQLKLKLNESFEEIVTLARENSPEFLTRFQEIYPNFINNILSKSPYLVNSELKFCAFLFLNFSTKEIANYTFTSSKTVQNRKNSIRKRLDIASDEDIYIWFQKMNGTPH